jgi:hypothetical protein
MSQRVKKGKARRNRRMKNNLEPKTTGTRIAEKARAKANSYSDSKRQAFLERGLALIYGNSGYVKADRNRR